MIRIELKRVEGDHEALLLSDAQENDYTTLIDQDAELYLDGKLVAVYINACNFPDEDIREELGKLKYMTTDRTGGLKSKSRIFGYMPRRVIRDDYCHAAKVNTLAPVLYHQMLWLSGYGEGLYSGYASERYLEHRKRVQDAVLEDWRLAGGSPWTSGIINRNTAIRYHRDSGNFADSWSCMFVLKRKMLGGYLVLPEFGVALRTGNRSITLFDGQAFIHGVTPLKPMGEDAERYSIVFYSLKGMSKCGTPDEEKERIRKVRTEREAKRAKKL